MVLPASSRQHKTTTSTSIPSPIRFINGLHYNFTLKWGRRRRLRCTKNAVTVVKDSSAASGGWLKSPVIQKGKLKPPERDQSPSEEASSMLHDLNVMKEKLIHDLRTSADGMIGAILEREKRAELQPAVTAAPALADENKRNQSFLRVRADMAAVKVGKRRRRSNSGKTERVEFCETLSKEEIEEDFMKMVGCRPPRRPKRRRKALQRKLDVSYKLP